MITIVPDMLTTAELAAIRTLLKSAPFVDGTTTAGGAARGVKNNQQVAVNSDAHRKLADIFRTAFQRNVTLQGALLPASATTVMFNRYSKGMQYGLHIDSALMGVMGNMLRTDVAMTLFLSDPDSYEGGELMMSVGNGIQHKFKGQAGSAIAYPANTLHEVTQVTAGTRDAAIVWVQSLVRDHARRELLWDMETAEQDIYRREGRSKAFEAVSRSHANLLRMWAEW